MFKGSFPAYLFPIISFFLPASSIIIVYYISQYLNQEKPFPHTWISATADHYPGFIIFRIGTIQGAVFLILGHVMSYFWVLQTAYDSVYNVRKLYPGFGTVLGIAGSMFLTASTALLDTGEHSTRWHVFCATTFFILTILSVWYHTCVSLVLYLERKAGSYEGLIAKCALSLGLILQVILQINDAQKYEKGIKSEMGNILEYTITFTLLEFFLVWAWDLRKYKLGYIYQK